MLHPAGAGSCLAPSPRLALSVHLTVTATIATDVRRGLVPPKLLPDEDVDTSVSRIDINSIAVFTLERAVADGRLDPITQAGDGSQHLLLR